MFVIVFEYVIVFKCSEGRHDIRVFYGAYKCLSVLRGVIVFECSERRQGIRLF